MIKERLERIEAQRKLARGVRPKIQTVRVMPASDAVRRSVKHPAGTRFPAEGPAEWPFDAFTKRRIREGAVTREEAPQQERRQRHRAAE